MTWIWISTNRITIAVEINADGELVDGPPYYMRWKGQQVSKFIRWVAAAHGGLRLALLHDPHRDRTRPEERTS